MGFIRASLAGRSLHPLHPSIEKEDRAQISAEEQWRLNRFKDAVALKAAFDGPDGAQHDEHCPPVASHEVEQPKFGVHLRARGKDPAEAGQGVHARRERSGRAARVHGALGRSLEKSPAVERGKARVENARGAKAAPARTT